MKKIKFLLLFIILSIGCTDESNIKDNRKFQEERIYETSGKVPIPQSLWNKLDEFYVSKFVGDKKTIEKRKENIPRSPMGFEVLLVEKKGAVLGGKNILLQFSKGGGHLNLSDYIKSKVVGSFLFGVKLPNADEIKAENFRVYHITNAKPNTKLGKLSACGAYSDVTKFFLQRAMTKGILVTNKDNRHISVLAGTFVFILIKGTDFFISQLTVGDSSNRKMLCSE